MGFKIKSTKRINRNKLGNNNACLCDGLDLRKSSVLFKHNIEGKEEYIICNREKINTFDPQKINNNRIKKIDEAIEESVADGCELKNLVEICND